MNFPSYHYLSLTISHQWWKLMIVKIIPTISHRIIYEFMVFTGKYHSFPKGFYTIGSLWFSMVLWQCMAFYGSLIFYELSHNWQCPMDITCSVDFGGYNWDEITPRDEMKWGIHHWSWVERCENDRKGQWIWPKMLD